MSDLRTTGICIWDEKWADEKLVISKLLFPDDRLEADRFRTARGGLLLFFFMMKVGNIFAIYLFYN